MYESHFGFKRRPFAATPDPRCFLASEPIQSALDELVVCVEQGQGVAIVSAPAGTGKTLLCERLRQELHERFKIVYLGHGRFLTRRAILQTILCDLNHSYLHNDEQELRLELLPAIRALSPQRDALVLICDEAHEFSEDLLEELRILSDFAEAGRPLVRLVLVGQHGLEETLTLPSLAALNQRIRAHIALDTLDRASSRDYIDYRLTWAGGRTAEVFEPAALELICQASDGVPRCINQLCDHALLLAYVADQKPVTAETIREALRDLRQLPLHWNEVSRVEPSTTSTDLHQDAGATNAFEEPFAGETANASSGEMLSFEFGADEPIDSRPRKSDDSCHSDEMTSTCGHAQADERRDDVDVGTTVESPQTNSFLFAGIIKSHENNLSDKSVREVPVIASGGSTDLGIHQSNSASHSVTTRDFMEEVVWDRYAAIDAGFEPTDPAQTEPAEPASNPSNADSFIEVGATESVVVAPNAASEIEPASHTDESNSTAECFICPEPNTTVPNNAAASNSGSIETSGGIGRDEVELRFRTVCDRLDQLLRHSADQPVRESSNVEVGAANSNPLTWHEDNGSADRDENDSSDSTEERLAADLSDMVHDLRDAISKDEDSIELVYARLDESLTINEDAPSDDSDATRERAGVGATMHEPGWSHESDAASNSSREEHVSSREEQVGTRPYRNLFTLLRRKQRGLA